MDIWKKYKGKFIFLLLAGFVFIVVFFTKSPLAYKTIPNLPTPTQDQPQHRPQHRPPSVCPLRTPGQTIIHLNNTEHLLVSAYMDQRVKHGDVRIIGIFRRDSIQPLRCVFCCNNQLHNSMSPAGILQHSDNFGFPFATTDVMCAMPQDCKDPSVTLLPDSNNMTPFSQTFLPVQNQESGGKGVNKFQFSFTVCISSLFGNYNNVLQLTQTLEMYRLLGVNRVVIYNTSCGPELDRMLQSYSEEGFVEVVPWPIDRHLTPSQGWLFSEHGGDLHYYGQLTTLNECIYRNMDRSRYVLLNDLDEIVMPYQDRNLTSLMNKLQEQHPTAGVFFIENHIFPKKHFEPSGKFHRPQWEGVPGINILEHIYREEPDRRVYHPYKMIVQPSAVEQTSVHSVLKSFRGEVRVPPSVCRIIHVRVALQGHLTKEQLNVDTRLWDFHKELIPRVDEVLTRLGLLNSKGQS